ncbi:MAG: efflux RND transporter periplasmic adaptor subunit [Candidatus Eiseniibacteriota bacterium]
MRAATLFVVLGGLLLGGCQGQERDAARAAAQQGAVAQGDSTAAVPADSAAAAETGRDEHRGGFLGLFGGGRDRDDEPEEAPAVPVELAAVSHRSMADFFATTATIEAEKEATLLAKTHGQVIELAVEEGDTVEKGQLLARLDDAEYQANLSQARVKANNMRREIERARSMAEKGLISERALADARYQLELSEAELERARLGVEHARVVAPFDGIVTARHIDLGEHAIEGTPLFDLADVEPLVVSVHMPERDVAAIDLDQLAIVEPDAAPGTELRGRVERIAPRVDPRTGTVKVTIELDPLAAHTRPGSFVRVRIRTAEHPEALAIPKRALVHEAGETFVFRAAADTVQRVPVATGFEDGRFVEVVDGLAAGDRVVRVGQGALKIGSHFVEVGAAAGDPDGRDEDEQTDTAMVQR